MSRPRVNGREPLENHPKYEKVRDLSAGAFGFVQLARNRRTGAEIAIKFIQRGPNIDVNVEREVVNHSNFCHLHIIQFREVFLTEEHLAIAMEYAPGGDLFTYVKKQGGLKENDARWFFQQIIVAIDYCHRKDTIHRDIKLENTLLDASAKPLVKLTDFGFTKNVLMSAAKTKVGTPNYTAPEIISTSRGAQYDGRKADIWSCGVILWVMLFCEYPFERAGDRADRFGYQRTLERIQRVDYKFPWTPIVSASCKDLLQRILVADPKARMSIEDIQQHKWYLKNLPPMVSQMNEECLRIQPHDYAGYQTVEQIKEVVRAAAFNPHSAAHEEMPEERVDEDGLDDVIDDILENDSAFM